MINQALGLDYSGWEVIDSRLPDGLPTSGKFVLKVDQAVKRRFKQGLIYLELDPIDIPDKIKILLDKGYNSLLVEPYVVHDTKQERYISMSRDKDGISLSYSRDGGVDIETAGSVIKSGIVGKLDLDEVASETDLSIGQLEKLIDIFNTQHMSFLEINPYIVDVNGELNILDVAIEVDSAAELIVSGWSESDLRLPATRITEEELIVRKLDSESPASFNLQVINPDGGIFLLLSGGGASVVIADEIFTMGYGDLLANYGEYSGNPNAHETDIYTEQVVQLLLKSKAERKVALIGGAVANFTDIKNTFKGIINVLERHGTELRKQNVKFYVRRGGPRQAEGLEAIKVALERLDILGDVYSPSTSIPTAVANVVKGLK